MVRLTIPAQHAFRDLLVSAVLAAVDAEASSADARERLPDVARERLPDVARERLPDVARDEIVSALGEAFNNIVLHAYRDVRGGTIDMRACATPTSVEVVLSDRGRSFDPSAIAAYAAPQMDDAGDIDDIDLDRLPEGGMGLFIIRSFMDEMTYVAGGGGRPNVLVLRKSWPLASAAPRSIASRSAAGAAHRLSLAGAVDPELAASLEQPRKTPENQARTASEVDRAGLPREALAGAPAPKKESSRSGWRMRSVAVPSYEQRTAGSLRRK